MVGFELWIVNNGTIFDNILVTDDVEYAKAQGEKLWRPTSKGEKEKKEAWDKENKPADEDPPADDAVGGWRVCRIAGCVGQQRADARSHRRISAANDVQWVFGRVLGRFVWLQQRRTTEMDRPE